MTIPSELPARLYQRDVVKGMVPIASIHLVGQYVQARGIDPSDILPPNLPWAGARDLTRVPAEHYCQMLIRAAERLNDPLLGLHLGQTVKPADLGPLGYVLLACENLGAALMRMQRYHRLVHDINPISHRLVGDQLELCWGVSHGKPGALFDEVGLSSLVAFGRSACGQPLAMTAVDFVNPPPHDLRPYTRYFGGPVRFGQPITRLVMPLSHLTLPLLQHDPTLLRLMEDQVNEAFARLPQTGDLADLTQQVITHLARHGVPELAQVAGELRLSPRVFYRRLAEQGLNFRDLRETALRQLAQLHLRDERLSVAEVGMLLGYSEQSAFSRAFQRWAGVSPIQWRKRWLEGKSSDAS